MEAPLKNIPKPTTAKPTTAKPTTAKHTRFKQDWKKYAMYTLYACLGYMFLFRPTRTGTIIGTWLHDLVGSFVHALKF